MRNLPWLVAAASLAGWALACGPGDPPPPVPVKQQPLTGMVGGQPFTARSATAHGSKVFMGDGGQKWIDVYDVPGIDCTVFSPGAQREVLATVPWQVTSYDLGLLHNVTLLSDGSHNEAVTDGRVEIVSAPAPDAGQQALIRIRAIGTNGPDGGSAVEGEVSLDVCD
jgi:hypothetical protein